MAQQVVEALTRLETATSRSGMILSVNSIEHSDERSSVIIGPAVEQALAFISSEVGEKRQAPDAICLDESVPLFGLVSRRQRLSTVIIRSGVSKSHSPSLDTIRKWSNQSIAPSICEKGGQLARAANYIQEHIR